MSLSLPHLVALARYGQMRSPLVFDLIEIAGGAKELWEMPAGDLGGCGLPPAAAERFARERRTIDPDGEMARLAAEGVEAVAIDDPRYPDRLRQICDPPPAIFVRGSVAALAADLPIAVVGTRRMTGYGQLAVHRIVPGLTETKAVVISGLALGIDAAAHAAALDAGGLTVAVLGSGVERSGVSPRTNAALAERMIAAGGAVISEYPPGTEPFKDHFPARNRIIAGLSAGIVVIEAAERSGSLITAARALDYDRDVFAVPGPIDRPTSSGPNGLLAKGAVLCAGAADILAYYGRERKRGAGSWEPEASLGPDERLIIRALENGPLPADDLAAASGLSPSRFLSALTGLEMAGLICLADGAYSYNIDSSHLKRLL